MFRYLASAVRLAARNGGPSILARLATRADYTAFQNAIEQVPLPSGLSERAIKILADLDEYGICIIKDFWSSEQCAAAREEVDRIIQKYPKYVNANAKADRRVYGANNVSSLIASFSDDEDLLAVASAYNREPTKMAFTLAARMPASDDNQGSGEGWHRDAFLRQFKAILYLSDVGQDNGPFQLINDSQRLTNVLSDMKAGCLKYMQYRLSEKDVAQVLIKEPQRLTTNIAQAGTVILVDTSTIHRGMPIKEGTRYALTNYYFPVDMVDQSMYEKFDVLPPTA